MAAARPYAALVAIALGLASPAQGQDASRTIVVTRDRFISEQAWDRGLVDALSLATTDSSVLLWPGAPILRGKVNIVRFLTAQPGLVGSRWSWQPLHYDFSENHRLALEWGTVTMVGPARGSAAPIHRTGRFLAAWQRNNRASYYLAAFALTGVTAASETVQVDSTGPREWPALLAAGATTPRALWTFAVADSAFAAAAAGNHAAEAFGKWAAPDAVTFAGDGTLNFGAAKIRAAVAAGGDGEWRWAPVLTFTSQGNYGKHQVALGYTVGQAVITSRDSAGKSTTFKSKYLTFWKTNPDGTVRFTADGGNGRP